MQQDSSGTKAALIKLCHTYLEHLLKKFPTEKASTTQVEQQQFNLDKVGLVNTLVNHLHHDRWQDIKDIMADPSTRDKISAHTNRQLYDRSESKKFWDQFTQLLKQQPQEEKTAAPTTSSPK